MGAYDTDSYALGVHVTDTYAWVADWANGLRTIDISEPSRPYEVGFYDTPGYACNVCVDQYAYVANARYGIFILQLTSTGTPGEHSSVPSSCQLSQNYPNPFNVSTKISYSLRAPGFTRLEIFNALGQRVAALADRQQSAGQKEILWDATDMTSGIYFYRLTAGDFSQVKKMMLVK